jgi:hypothetical protein
MVVLFVAEAAVEGGFIARALRYSIFTEADDWAALQKAVIEAAHCHFGRESLRSIQLCSIQVCALCG